MHTRGFLAAGVAVAALLQPGLTEAQEAATAPSALEEVVVTGSRIRGVAPVGSSIISVEAEEIVKQPAANVQELLKRVPQVAGFGYDASSQTPQGGGTNTTRGSAINLRGLGPQSTLVLLEGARMPTSGVTANYVDPTGIPGIALDRIEVVADGASAVYGADAVAGVVNFILKKNFDGVQTRGRYAFADGYSQKQVSVLGGHGWGSGRAMVALEYFHNTPLNGTERDFVRSDLRDRGGRDYRTGQCNPGNIIAGGVSYAIPAGGVTQATAGQLVRNTRNLCETYNLADILPRITRRSAVITAEQDITEDLRFYVNAVYSKRDYKAQGVQQGSSSVVATLTVPQTNAFFVRPPGFTGSSVSVEYNFAPELGLLQQGGFARFYEVTGGFKVNLPWDWQADISGFYGRDDGSQETQRVFNTALTQRLASSNPALAFNPFGGVNNREVLDTIYQGIFNPYARNHVEGAQVQANGPLFDLPGGTARLAVGAEYNNYSFVGSSRQNSFQNPVYAQTSNTRNQRSVFAELFVPIVGADNAMPGVQKLDLSLAGRLDHYDDFGRTTNPKVGVNWTPFDGLVLRGSYGTSFRAPLLQDTLLIRAGSALVVQTVPDAQSPTGSSTGYGITSGNPDLKPERAKTYSLGFDFSPTQLPGARASVSWFKIDLSDQIVTAPGGGVSLNLPIWQSIVTRNPSPALIQSYIDLGLRVNGIPPAVPAFLINNQSQNFGSTKMEGFDFDLSYRWTTGLGAFDATLIGSRVYRYDVQVTPIAPVADQLGLITNPPKLRAQAILGWANGDWDAEATVNYAHSYINNTVTPAQKVSSWTTIDLHLGYRFEDVANRWLEGVAVALDVNNVFAKDPPFVNIQGGFDPGGASALGRLVAITLDKRW